MLCSPQPLSHIFFTGKFARADNTRNDWTSVDTHTHLQWFAMHTGQFDLQCLESKQCHSLAMVLTRLWTTTSSHIYAKRGEKKEKKERREKKRKKNQVMEK